MKINIAGDAAFIGELTTVGRITGKSRAVKLRLVRLGGKFYASRTSHSGDWLLNLLANPEVSVRTGEGVIAGRAALVENAALSRRISELKYSDERRELARVVVEITPAG
ncbi:MAG: nitroreductase/quinone reductase family protein [Deltaproteobacteria bacterium]